MTTTLLTTCACWAGLASSPVLHDPAVRLHGDQLVISARLEDPAGLVETVEVRLWAYDRLEATAMAVEATTELQLIVPAAPFFAGQDSTRLMYLLVGLGPDGEEVVRLGSETEPHSIILTRVVGEQDLAVPPPLDKAWYQSWWLWIGAAGAVIVAGTVTAIALANDF